MKNRIKGIIKRVVSGLSAAAMMAGNIFPAVPITASAEAAHTINVFDINLKSGADYYSTYTPDDPTEGTGSLSNAYVWQADSSNAGHKFVYNIKLSISGVGNSGTGEEATKENFIKIRIPEHILKFSEHSTAAEPADTVEMPVPNISQIEYKLVNGKKVYATDHQFVYDYDKNTKEYVIFNIAPVSAGVVYEFPVAYIMDKNTWEYEDLGSSEPFKAKVDIASWDKSDENTPVTLTQKTREIPVYVDTAAEITKTNKKAEEVSGEVLISANEAKSKMGLDTDLDEGYKYVVWSVVSDISDVTQKYSLKLADAPTPITGDNEVSIKGEVVAVKMGSTVFQGDALSNCEITGLTASGKRTDYVLARYSKEAVEALDNKPKPATYTAQNKVTMTLTPADGKDKPSVKQDNAVFQYEVKDPTWHPVEVSFSAEKFGLYNNGKNRVSSKSNISSYSLSKLAAEGETVSGLQYETKSTAHAYGKTITDLEHEITELVFSGDHNTVTAGNRIYVFDPNDVETYSVNNVTKQISGTYTAPLTDLDKQIIIGRDIADTYYGQQPLDYILDDKTFTFADINKPAEIIDLTADDYCINSVSYSYLVRKVEYDADKMEFSAGDDNVYDDVPDHNILEFYVYNDGAETPELVGSYDLLENEASIVNSALVKSITADSIVFADDANITGYQIKTSNKYFYVELKTRPSITLKASETIKPIVDKIVNENNKEKKAAVSNTCKWTVKNGNKDLLNSDKTATDYIADIIRKSSISKKALGEKTYITGQDGKVYRSSNDTLIGQYQLAWQTTVKETADGIEVNGSLANGVPVAQQSGVFYDLLPSHSDIIEGSVNVYVDAAGDVGQNTTPLPSSSFKVYERKDNYNGSGKKLLKIEINAPCNSSYTVTYVTVHSHEDIQDYGSFALNTVAYQTGNEDIGNGYPDDGGNYAVSMSAYIKGLDPENGSAKRFIYAEATEDILALFPTSSGIYKKVSTQSDPSYRKTGVVHNGETYTYNIRMKNDSSTKATDIAILDSVENFRKVGDAVKPINSGLDQDRGWNGTIVSFDLKGIEDKMGNQKNDLKLILYTGKDPVNLDDENYSDVENRKYVLYRILGEVDKANNVAGLLSVEDKLKADAVARNWKEYNWENPDVDLSTVTAFIVYTGEDFTLPEGESLSFTVKMQAPKDVKVEGKPDVANGVFLTAPETYNNVYRSFTSSMDTSGTTKKTYFYTHYDYTQVKYSTVGTVKFSKRDSATGETIPGVTFNLSGISDYGTAYNETLVSDGNGVVTFKNLERGTYQLIESISDDDHLIDATPRTVMVNPHGRFTFVKVDGSPMITFDEEGNFISGVSDDPDVVIDDNGSFSIKNDPRYHGDFKFRKVDSLSGNGIGGTKFTLSGTSMYNTVYTDLEAESDANGNVVFENLEKGTYTLTETAVSSGYLPPENNTYTVTCTGTRDLIFKIEGEGSEYKNGEYRIKNTPTAEMILQKVDSITKDTLDDAQFTLTADDDLNDTLYHLTNNVTDTPWTVTDGKYVQTVNWSNIAAKGCYSFGYLPEGTYTLTETAPPTGYAQNGNSYTIDVVKSTDKTKLVIKLPSGGDMQYIKIENGDFVTADEDTATLYRLTNDQTYKDGKTLVKSWVGGVGDSFPSMHLSSEKPEAVAVKVTIGTALKDLVLTSTNKPNIKAFEKAESLPSTVSEDSIPAAFMDNDSGEDGKFYAWYDTNSKKVYWWSDADIIYLPRSCQDLFNGCNNSNFKTLDLSAFSSEKTTSMQAMFKDCSSLTSINLDPKKFVGGSNLTTVSDMFNSCNKLEGIDLRGFGNCPNLTNADNWFYGCYYLKYIDLSNFVPSTNLNSMKSAFRYAGNGKNGTKGSTIDDVPGCAVFANDWNTGVEADVNDNNAYDNYWRVKLYGTVYKNSGNASFEVGTKQGDPSHLIKVLYDDWLAGRSSTGNYNGPGTFKFKGTGNPRLYGGYFNDPESDYYKTEFDFPSGYHDKMTEDSSQPSTTTSNSNPIDISSITFATYPNFTKTGSVKQAENTTATEKDVGKTTFKFEYVTEETAVPLSGTTYEVDETIFMTVSQIVKEGETYYTVSQKYKYNGTPVKAKWTKFGDDAPTQWKCEMKVFNADDEFFAWESAVSGFTSTADENSPIRTVGRSDEPVITNASSGTPIGDLKLSKVLEGEKYSKDTFTFKVTMWKSDDQTDANLYKMLPFDENGVAYFDVKPNVPDEDKVIIKGIPAGCTYTVTEVGINGKTDGLNGEYTFTSEGQSGTIEANNTMEAKITNTIVTADLSLTKNVVLEKNTAEAQDVFTAAENPDPDYIKWAAEDFSFTITFENLVAGQEYTYTIGETQKTFNASTSSAETAVNITLKGGQTVTFVGIPVGTKYTIVETSEFEDTEGVTYTTANNKNGESETTDEQTLSANGDTVTFTNTKQIDKTLAPEYVEVTVNKEWYSKDGKKVDWLKHEEKYAKFKKNENGEYVPDPDNGAYVPYTSTDGGVTKTYLPNFPSFLKIYLGRALKVPKGVTGEYTYLDVTTGIDNASINVQGNWSKTFTELDKYGEIVKYDEAAKEYVKVRCEYVYFVSEVTPIGYSNTNPEIDKTDIVKGEYFEATGAGDEKTITLTNKADETFELTVCKLVTGNFGNKAKDFDFEIELKDNKNKPIKGTGVTVIFTDMYNNDAVLRSRTYTLEQGKLTVKLPHGVKIKFVGLPKGINYTIKELNKGEYTLRSGTYTGDVFAVEAEDLEGGEVLSGTLTADTNYVYMNDLTGVIPTGIGLSGTTAVIVFFLTTGGIAYLLLRRRKEQTS